MENSVLIKTYKEHNFIPPSLDALLDWRNRLKILKEEISLSETDQWYDNEIEAIDYLLKKHYN